MIDSTRGIKFFDSIIHDTERWIATKPPTIQLAYEVALTILRVGAFALLTCLSPVGSVIISLGCYTANQYYKLIKEQKIKEQLQGNLTKEALDKLLLTSQTLSYVNRIQHEFELVNLVTLVALQHLNVPLFLICGGMSIWSWYEDSRAETLLLQTITSAQQDIRSQELDS